MPRVSAGQTIYSFLVNASAAITAPELDVVDADDATTIIIERATDDITSIGGDNWRWKGAVPDDADIGDVYVARWYRNSSDDEPAVDTITFEVVAAGQEAGPAGPTFATRADVATSLGRELTVAEDDQVDLLLVLATGAIAEAASRDLDWAADLSPVPTMLRILCLEVVRRVLQNPEGLKSGSESLGAYSHSGTYAAAGAIELTDREERLARRAIHGHTSGSVMLGSIFQEAENA